MPSDPVVFVPVVAPGPVTEKRTVTPESVAPVLSFTVAVTQCCSPTSFVAVFGASVSVAGVPPLPPVPCNVALVEPIPLETLLDRVLLARPRFSLLVLGIFACAGVLLVALGVYGVLAYTVSQQTREIAIRLALGGDRGHVVRMVLRLGMQMVAVGLVIGVAVSFATNRLLRSELWGTTPTDPVTFAAAILVTLAIGAIACLVPARRAVRIEPMVALRHE